MAFHPPKRAFILSHIAAFLALIYANTQSSCAEDGESSSTCLNSDVSSLGPYLTWGEAPSSGEEFDHDNDPRICGVPRLTVEQWEQGKFWEEERPIFVINVTDGWKSLEHWTKEEMIRRYPDVMVGMGDSRSLGQTGPDDPDKGFTKTTIKDFVLTHMHNNKYVFDRKLNMPDSLLEDCQPYPMPTRMYHENSGAVKKSGLAERLMWKDHLALTIGSDLQGLTFHRHNAAWNVVVFGSKRWILYDAERIHNNQTRLKRMTRDIDNPVQLTGANWIRKLYPMKERLDEIRQHGHDCVQREGELLYVPRGWAHMVVNIGDTVAIVSERGLDVMEP